jgi:hypothetical protein
MEHFSSLLPCLLVVSIIVSCDDDLMTRSFCTADVARCEGCQNPHNGMTVSVRQEVVVFFDDMY